MGAESEVSRPSQPDMLAPSSLPFFSYVLLEYHTHDHTSTTLSFLLYTYIHHSAHIGQCVTRYIIHVGYLFLIVNYPYPLLSSHAFILIYMLPPTPPPPSHCT